MKALSVLTAMVLAVSTSALAETKASVVLVHGAFADDSSWNKVITRLQKHHTEVIAVQLPLTSLKDDVAATQRAIARAHGDVVLVGHSWGGTVISEAGNNARMMNGPTSGHAILRALCTSGSCNEVMCGFVTNAPSPLS